MDVTHLGVIRDFLNGQLKEIIFMHLPDGYYVSNLSNRVLRLKRQFMAKVKVKQNLVFISKITITVRKL